MKIHIVQKGDTLWKIAKKYGVNFEELKKLNSQLSNPDMIMPGMKVKVPTTGGLIKKETPMGTKPGTAASSGAKKEIPFAGHPFAKEQPKPLPIKEKPIVKEAPKAPYTPKMPISVAPEIDINNYYTMNMANMNVQQPQPKPKPAKPPAPVVKELPKKEVPVPVMPVVEAPVECPPPIVEQPICEPECVPITPVMPGPGFCPPMGYPLEPAVPYQDFSSGAVPMVSGNLPYAADPGGPYVPPHFEDESSSSYLPQIPMTYAAPSLSGGNPPVQPVYPQPGAVQGGQIPVGYPAGMPAEYAPAPTAYPTGGYPGYPAGVPTGGYPGYPAGPTGVPTGGHPGYPAGPAGVPTGGYPGYPAGSAGVPTGGYPGYSAGPAGVPTGGYPGYPAGSAGVPTGGYPGYSAGPAGVPTGGYPGYPQAAYSEPGLYPRISNDYGLNQSIAGSDAFDQANVLPYGPMPYGYPQGTSGADLYHFAGQPSEIPAGTGSLGDCGCSDAAAQSFVPTTPPVYMAPYTAPVHLAQPPFMNPYGIGTMGDLDPGSYMRHKDESTEEND